MTVIFTQTQKTRELIPQIYNYIKANKLETITVTEIRKQFKAGYQTVTLAVDQLEIEGVLTRAKNKLVVNSTKVNLTGAEHIAIAQTT